ncbi:hypothetical protein TNCV_3324111 [Trichonephila clavipes]|nr:hypothetical protein TNCV_3324111 [Trichonephila clavipes]
MKQEMQLFDSTENPLPNIIKLCEALKTIPPMNPGNDNYIPGISWAFPGMEKHGKSETLERVSLHQKEPVNSLKNQTRVYSHLRRSCDVVHSCSDNVPGTTTNQRARYNLNLHTPSAGRPVSLLNKRSFYALGKWIVNDDFQKDKCSRNFPFSAFYRNAMQYHCQAYQTTSGRNFVCLLLYNLSIKCFLSH